MRADKSTPQVGHVNTSGCRNISGMASKAYFAPQSQMTFMGDQGLGLSRVTPAPAGNAIGVCAGKCSALPSENKNTPPYL